MQEVVKNHIKQLFAVIFLACGLACWPALAMQKASVEVVSGEKTHVFNVDIAATTQEKMQGLMFVESLPEDRGMLFVETTPRVVSMWMKNTLIALDMLFVGADGRIVHIEHRAKPQTLRTRTAGVPVMAVLELAGGVAETYGIKEGDRLTWQISDLQ